MFIIDHKPILKIQLGTCYDSFCDDHCYSFKCKTMQRHATASIKAGDKGKWQPN